MMSDADAIRRLTHQHVRIRSLLLLLPLVFLSTSMALVSSGLVSDDAGGALAFASIATVALVILRFRRTFGVVVPAPPPPSQHVVRDSLVGLIAMAIAVGLPIIVWVNVAGLGLMDLAFLTGAGGVTLSGATMARRWYWGVPVAAWLVMIVGAFVREPRPQMASLYLLVAAAVLVAVVLEYRAFTRRLTDGR
jgi:hypothetical protein